MRLCHVQRDLVVLGGPDVKNWLAQHEEDAVESNSCAAVGRIHVLSTCKFAGVIGPFILCLSWFVRKKINFLPV